MAGEPFRLDNPDGSYFELEFGTLPDKGTFVIVEYDKEGTPVGAAVEEVAYLIDIAKARKELKLLEQIDRIIT